uniref:CSON011834 protein n=1 Tax=Culicoides sonorensis TaxID=179676 RepID=A0A336M416_CULSO
MNADYVQGTCEEMCPLSEMKHRLREKLVHFYEKDRQFVKEFARSAAGQKFQKPHELRTKEALLRTVRYLLTDIFNDSRRAYHFKFDFIFDRLRCVRQEIVIQNLDIATTIQLLEPVIMFLAYSRYRLADEAFHNFDPKICEQHLQECLKKILVCYDDLPRSQLSDNRITIEALYLIFNLGRSEALLRGISLPKIVKKYPLIKLALKISINFWQNNHFSVLKQMKDLPPMLLAVASLKINHIRRHLLLTFSVAYSSKQLSVPIEWLRRVLMYDEKDKTIDLIDHLKYYGIEYSNATQTVKFEKKFDMDKQQISASTHAFVEQKLNCDNFEDYFLLNSESD